jgi:hypothetical protein
MNILLKEKNNTYCLINIKDVIFYEKVKKLIDDGEKGKAISCLTRIGELLRIIAMEDISNSGADLIISGESIRWILV